MWAFLQEAHSPKRPQVTATGPRRRSSRQVGPRHHHPASGSQATWATWPRSGRSSRRSCWGSTKLVSSSPASMSSPGVIIMAPLFSQGTLTFPDKSPPSRSTGRPRPLRASSSSGSLWRYPQHFRPRLSISLICPDRRLDTFSQVNRRRRLPFRSVQLHRSTLQIMRWDNILDEAYQTRLMNVHV